MCKACEMTERTDELIRDAVANDIEQQAKMTGQKVDPDIYVASLLRNAVHLAKASFEAGLDKSDTEIMGRFLKFMTVAETSQNKFMEVAAKLGAAANVPPQVLVMALAGAAMNLMKLAIMVDNGELPDFDAEEKEDGAAEGVNDILSGFLDAVNKKGE